MSNACCFDLQAVLQVPCGDVNMFYYKRKLGVYNFTIYDTSSRDGFIDIVFFGMRNKPREVPMKYLHVCGNS